MLKPVLALLTKAVSLPFVATSRVVPANAPKKSWPVPRADVLARMRVPPLAPKEVDPVYELLAARVRDPAPVNRIPPPVPLIFPPSVILPPPLAVAIVSIAVIEIALSIVSRLVPLLAMDPVRTKALPVIV